MIRIPKRKTEIVIDLMGQEGNAYWLLGYAKDFCKTLGFTKEQTQLIHDQMTSGNYHHLVAVFEHYFGSFVVLEADKDLRDAITKELKEIGDNPSTEDESLEDWINGYTLNKRINKENTNEGFVE